MCVLQQPGQVEHPWEVQGYWSWALLGKGKKGPYTLMSLGIWHTLLGVSSQHDMAVTLVWCENGSAVLCILHLTQPPLLCLALGNYVSHKINACTLFIATHFAFL